MRHDLAGLMVLADVGASGACEEEVGDLPPCLPSQALGGS
jgi:hypothetical protein